MHALAFTVGPLLVGLPVMVPPLRTWRSLMVGPLFVGQTVTVSLLARCLRCLALTVGPLFVGLKVMVSGSCRPLTVGPLFVGLRVRVSGSCRSLTVGPLLVGLRVIVSGSCRPLIVGPLFVGLPVMVPPLRSCRELTVGPLSVGATVIVPAVTASSGRKMGAPMAIDAMMASTVRCLTIFAESNVLGRSGERAVEGCGNFKTEREFVMKDKAGWLLTSGR